ncbi:MAG: hypothetical protein FWG25_05985 [Promicromonosporaceae bacterium]|nr:hypothetical protein [Promicromonosporaceae bacterium]
MPLQSSPSAMTAVPREPLWVRRRRKNRRAALIAVGILVFGVITFLVTFNFTYQQALSRVRFGSDWERVWTGRDFNDDQFVVAVSPATADACAFGAIVTNRGWRGWQVSPMVWNSAQSGRLEIGWNQDPTVVPLGWSSHVLLYGNDALTDLSDLTDVFPPGVAYSVSQDDFDYVIHLVAPLSEMPGNPFRLLEEASLIGTWLGPDMVCQR